ncbi:hypothetical protein [Paracoccus sp. ME4]|uniref:hypothetical protein n=1 Tax=Paracoccus sp. ME4 TaxID=3138066 RepID=UPI00398A5174
MVKHPVDHRPTTRTPRSIDGRLFPNREWDTGWALSIQADGVGYGCSPAARLQHIEDYDEVEVRITPPFVEPVDHTQLGLTPELAAKFDEWGNARNLDWRDVEALSTALTMAGMNPNAGIPRGAVGWAGREIFHGTDEDAALDIRDCGISMAASSKGYFGRAFYAADDRQLARAAYAEMADGDPAILSLVIEQEARILDLRNPLDAAEWAPWADRVSYEDFDRMMRRAGIDGIYDRSVGGLAIYNPKAVRVTALEPVNDRDAGIEL